MKKYRLLFLSILLLMISFVMAWYKDHLINHLWILVIPINAVLLVCFVVLLVMSIRRIIKRKEYYQCFNILVLALLVGLMAFFPFKDAKVRYELNRFEADRLKIVEMIKNNQLQPKDRLGNVSLPFGYTEA